MSNAKRLAPIVLLASFALLVTGLIAPAQADSKTGNLQITVVAPKGVAATVTFQQVGTTAKVKASKPKKGTSKKATRTVAVGTWKPVVKPVRIGSKIYELKASHSTVVVKRAKSTKVKVTFKAVTNRERAALLALVIDNPGKLTGWDRGNHCKFDGVSCDSKKRVYYLNLFQKGLTKLPARIGDLTYLRGLKVNSNHLTRVPSQIGKLKRLEHLYLDANKLKTVPSEVGNLKQLRTLSLGYNELTAVPAKVTKLTKLRSLDLDGNDLTSLPSQIGKLSRLQSLGAAANELRSLPSSISNLTKLQYLGVGQNKISAVPAGVSKLTNLTVLDLSYNRLAGDVSPWVQSLRVANKIQTLYLVGNSGCLTANTEQLADWLSSKDPNWNDGCRQ